MNFARVTIDTLLENNPDIKEICRIFVWRPYTDLSQNMIYLFIYKVFIPS